MSLVAVIQPWGKEAAVGVVNNATSGVTAQSGVSLTTFKFTMSNANASPSTSGGMIYTVNWGDNTTATTSTSVTVNAGTAITASPAHTYASPGRYTVRITTTTNDRQKVNGTSILTIVVS